MPAIGRNMYLLSSFIKHLFRYCCVIDWHLHLLFIYTQRGWLILEFVLLLSETCLPSYQAAPQITVQYQPRCNVGTYIHHMLHVSVHRTFAKVRTWPTSGIHLSRTAVTVPTPTSLHSWHRCNCKADSNFGFWTRTTIYPTQIKSRLWSDFAAQYTKQITKAVVGENIIFLLLYLLACSITLYLVILHAIYIEFSVVIFTLIVYSCYSFFMDFY